MEYDVFISHASEDKDAVARPLAVRLQELGVKVWLDELELTLGDSLRKTIDNGLSQSRFGIVILSRDFFNKDWPKRELDGLAAREEDHQKVILPVWHNIDRKEIVEFSPTLADRLAVSTAEGIETVAQKILRAIGKPIPKLRKPGPIREIPNQPRKAESPKVIIPKPIAPARRVSKRAILLILAGAIITPLLLFLLLHRSDSAQPIAESTPTPQITQSLAPPPTPSPTLERVLSNPKEAILKRCTFSGTTDGTSIDCIIFNNFLDKRIKSIEIEIEVPTPVGAQVVQKWLEVKTTNVLSVSADNPRGWPLLESHYSGWVVYRGAHLHSKSIKVYLQKTSEDS